MNILAISKRDRYERYLPEILTRHSVVFKPMNTSDEELLAAAPDAEILLVDAIAPAREKLIGGLPRLKMIHSEGVGYEGVDTAAAAKRGVFVCNSKGCNAGAVAEQAVMLMLMFLRSAVVGDREERAGRQIQMKERLMIEGITELGDCTVGLVGFGDIARATAERLAPFGCPEILYYAPHRKDPETEARYHVRYAALDELAAQSDIVSIHSAVTPSSRGMINDAFISNMKKTAFIVNTARGEIVDNLALRKAIIEGRIAGAALDTVAPEPTTADNPLVDLPPEARDRVVFAPHLGGITVSTFKRAYRNMGENIARIERGEKPAHIVNGL
jgi:phosphoglycerate dehydrogenase-like enzyme